MAAGEVDPARSDSLAAAARQKREMAQRTRRLASTLSLNRDRETLLSYAAALEHEAETLERQAAVAFASARSRL